MVWRIGITESVGRERPSVESDQVVWKKGWLCSMTLRHRIQQKWPKNCFSDSILRFFHINHTVQTLLPRNSTCLDLWNNIWQDSASSMMMTSVRMWQNGFTCLTRISWGVASIPLCTDGKNASIFTATMSQSRLFVWVTCVQISSQLIRDCSSCGHFHLFWGKALVTAITSLLKSIYPVETSVIMSHCSSDNCQIERKIPSKVMNSGMITESEMTNHFSRLLPLE